MDNTNSNIKNLLVELESLRSKESIYKMKESNFIRDKEILEDSIGKFQAELQEKSETIRSLRRDLNTQSSNLFKDLQIKNNELDKVILENEDLKKQNIIFQETTDHQVQRLETLQSEMDKQLKIFERELECKSKLVGFYESSNQQKDVKISAITTENEQYKQEINNMEAQLNSLNAINEEMIRSYEESSNQMKHDIQDKDLEIHRIRNEILQLQQNGISEFHLEKMNPVAAATLKVFKSSKGLMEIYSELHCKISEVDRLEMEKNRLKRNYDSLESELNNTKIYADKLKNESDETSKMNESLKSRLLSLVTDLRTAQSKQSDLERQLMVSRKNLQSSNSEIERLNEQVSLFIVVAENGSQIKQEAVDADSGLYASVSELQEINRALRLHNEDLITQLESGDSEQYKRKCEELQKYVDKTTDEINQLRQENSVNKSQIILHEKQIQLLRYLIELKSPGSSAAIENGLKRIEFGSFVNLDCDNEMEPELVNSSMENVTKEENFEQLIHQQDGLISEFIENKRASDEVYKSTIDQMRTQIMELSKKSNDLSDKLENALEKLTYENEMNERYHQESDLLRSINKNLLSNSSNLESVIEDLKMKLQTKISLLAERKADLDSCKNLLDLVKSENLRLKIEREDLNKTVEVQDKIFANMSSLKNGIELADHISKIQVRNKIENLEESMEKTTNDLRNREENIECLKKQLDESRALNLIRNSISYCNMSCQVDLSLFEEFAANEEINTKSIIDEGALINCKNQIASLQVDKLELDKTILELTTEIERYKTKMQELTEKCAFLETQISLQEKARQEILSENIKITEEAHKMNASLKQDLHNSQEELSAMKIRLEEAETVERTVQEVIDKYIKESNEAKAKYKRELTLHAADSKLLETAKKEIDTLQSLEKSFEIERSNLKLAVKDSEQSRKQQIDEIQARLKDLERKLQECENRNESLYEQLKEISSQQGSNSIYMEIIEDLKNQIDIQNMSTNLSDVQKERYENEISRLRESLSDTNKESKVTIERLNKRLSGSSVSLVLDPEVIRESNCVLRQQKEQLERNLINVKCEMEDLTDQVCVLESRITELSEQKNTLILSKSELEDEKNRWKERCRKLVERAEQMDPEQYRLACNDRDKYRKLSQELEIDLKETKDSDRVKIEEHLHRIIDLEKNLEKAELDRRKLEELSNKLTVGERMVAQLKDIGRKHKGESERRGQYIIELEKKVLEFQEQQESLYNEKEKLMEKLRAKETEFELAEKELKELKTRCDILEKVNKTRENTIEELKHNVGQLESDLGLIRNLKRSRNDSEEIQNEKRQKLDEETKSTTNSDSQCDEEMDESETEDEEEGGEGIGIAVEEMAAVTEIKGKENVKEEKGNEGKENEGRRNEEKVNEVKENKGKEHEVKENEGQGNEVKENEGKENDGKGNEVKENEEKRNEVKENEGKGNEVKESEGKGNEVKENEGKGNEVKENEGKGNEVKENEGKGNEVKENEGKGNEVKESEGKGNEVKDNEGKGNEVKENEGKGNEGKEYQKEFEIKYGNHSKSNAEEIGEIVTNEILEKFDIDYMIKKAFFDVPLTVDDELEYINDEIDEYVNEEDEDNNMEDDKDAESSRESNQSVVLIESDSDRKEGEEEEDEEDYEAIVLNVESSLENLDEMIEKETAENVIVAGECQHQQQSNNTDLLWNDKLINLVVTSNPIIPENSNDNSNDQGDENRPIMTRSRLRRQLRRPNQPTD